MELHLSIYLGRRAYGRYIHEIYNTFFQFAEKLAPTNVNVNISIYRLIYFQKSKNNNNNNNKLMRYPQWTAHRPQIKVIR